MAETRSATDGPIDKDAPVHIERVESSPANEAAADPVLQQGEAHMTKAKWLAAFALGLAYMTAFQQGACTGGILKSIDEKLGTATPMDQVGMLWTDSSAQVQQLTTIGS